MAKMSDAANPNWWDQFFPAFRPVFDTIPLQKTNADVKYFIKKLNLRPRQRFLDCPCGIGRISVPLARKGIRVTGVDVTQSYLDELTQKARRMKLKINVVHSDMRRINFDSEFDAAGNLGTSFGYFESESDNLLALKKIYRALKPGGKFLLEVVNRDFIMKRFTPRDWQLCGNIKILQTRQFDYATSINRTTWRFIDGGREQVYSADLRMYSYHELLAMLREVGFTSIQGFGSTRDKPIDNDHLTMFIIAARPRN